MNIKEAIEESLRVTYLELAQNTARSYSIGLGAFTTYLQENHISPTDDVTKLTVDHFINVPPWMATKGYKRKTIFVYLSGVKSFLNWLVLQKYLEPDYSQGLRITKAFQAMNRRREDHMIRWPEKDDVDKLIEAVWSMKYTDHPHPELERARNIALVQFLASSGCRNFEVCSLTVGMLDLKNRKVIVRGKGDKDRYIFFDQATVDALRYYFAVRKYSDRTDPVFCRHDLASTHKGIPKRQPIGTNTVRNIVDAACDVAGIEKGKFTPHYFRHAFAIKMLRETGNLALVQDLLGHADPKATRVYAKIDRDELREAHHEVFK